MILTTLLHELTSFLGLGAWITMIQSGDYSSLRTWGGFTGAIGPLLPLMLVFEIVRALWTRTFRGREYRVLFFIYLFNRVISGWVSIAAVAFAIGAFTRIAPFSLRITWYGLLYGYVVWELGHFIYHYLAHKIRILWCLHSTHHAPEDMNLFVSNAHFFLEAPYADIIRTSTCILLGLSPPLLFLIMFIDGFWGTFIHAGEHLLADGRLGRLEPWILTPSHHRVHHARNPLYNDTNFCNLLNIWDRAFGTLQREERATPPEYGITRQVNAGNFLDIYFGEIVLLGRDVWQAPGTLNKLRYIVMPPGWSHTGEHKTASALRQAYLHGKPADVHRNDVVKELA